MKSKQFLMLACSAFILVTSSCKKDDGGTNTSQAATMADVSYGSDARQKMDIYLPAGRSTENTKVAVLVHGGAWVTGDKADLNEVVAGLKTQLPDYAIVNINYRLVTSSSTLWPAQDEDMTNALNLIISEGSKHHYNPDKIVLIGASAGAHLAMLQAYNGSAIIKPKIKAVVDLFGPTDITALYNFYANAPQLQAGLQFWLGGTPGSNAAAYNSASPIKFISAQAPPTIIFHGTADATVPIAQSESLKNSLTTAGVVNEYYTYAGAGHGWETDPVKTLDTYSKAVAFIKKNVP